MGRTVALMALRDTGHRLRDISGNPVLTVELRCFPQLAAEVSQLPAVEALPLLRRKYPELRPQLFRAIVQPSPQQFLWRGDGFFFDVPS